MCVIREKVRFSFNTSSIGVFKKSKHFPDVRFRITYFVDVKPNVVADYGNCVEFPGPFFGILTNTYSLTKIVV
jgi:hypothetical protein